VDADKLLATAADNLSVRRAFGAAYEKDGILIIPVAIVAGGGGAGTRHGRNRHFDSGGVGQGPPVLGATSGTCSPAIRLPAIFRVSPDEIFFV
jgi:uncharacterized spore protein YtfJ